MVYIALTPGLSRIVYSSSLYALQAHLLAPKQA